MGRSPCCEKEHTNKGAWSKEEDQRLINYIKIHGEGCWRSLPKAAGLLRCGKSCRLRWINYLRPDLKRGNFTQQEDDLIISLHSLLGNKWSLIAARMPGRTDNEIKNYWNTHIKRKLYTRGIDPSTHRPLNSTATNSDTNTSSSLVATTNNNNSSATTSSNSSVINNKTTELQLLSSSSSTAALLNSNNTHAAQDSNSNSSGATDHELYPLPQQLNLELSLAPPSHHLVSPPPRNFKQQQVHVLFPACPQAATSTQGLRPPRLCLSHHHLGLQISSSNQHCTSCNILGYGAAAATIVTPPAATTSHVFRLFYEATQPNNNN